MPHEYIVQVWLDGKAGAWQRISADSELEAAELITGVSLTTVGKLAELRARVRVVGKLSKRRLFTHHQNRGRFHH
jgi:hypothetical protein